MGEFDIVNKMKGMGDGSGLLLVFCEDNSRLDLGKTSCSLCLFNGKQLNGPDGKVFRTKGKLALRKQPTMDCDENLI